MARTNLHFDVSGDVQLARRLARMAAHTQDVRPVWREAARTFAREQRRTFASGRWAPLSPPYARWKARAFPGASILVRTGGLRRSLTSRPLGVEDIRPQEMTIGSNVAHGRFHQQGTATMPARPLIRVRSISLRSWVRRLWQHIDSERA